MVLRLKENLIIDTLHPRNEYEKYSKSILNLKTLKHLEENEPDFEFSKNILDLFKELEEKENNFYMGVPLKIFERYYFSKTGGLNTFINFEYNEKTINVKTSVIFLELEELYQKIFLLGSLIANYYNIEIKINDNTKNNVYV